MANRFGTDILIQAPDPKKAALFMSIISDLKLPTIILK
jgi:hypothetical protein